MTYSGNLAGMVRETVPALVVTVATFGLAAPWYLAKLDAYRATHVSILDRRLGYRADPGLLFRIGTGPLWLSIVFAIAVWWSGTRYLAFEAPDLAWAPSILVPPLLLALTGLFGFRLRRARLRCLEWNGLSPRLAGKASTAAWKASVGPLVWLASLGYILPTQQKRGASAILNALWLGERKLNLDPDAIQLPWVRFAVGWTMGLAVVGGAVWFGPREGGFIPEEWRAEISPIFGIVAAWLVLVAVWLIFALLLVPYRFAFRQAMASGIRTGGLSVSMEMNPVAAVVPTIIRVLLLGLTMGLAAPVIAHLELRETMGRLRIGPRDSLARLLEDL